MSAMPPVFIVGLPRSGTTLLAAMLGAHSQMDCGPETHFFAQLRRAPVKRILQPERWPASGVAFVRSLVADGKPVHELFALRVEDIESFLRSREPRVQALLESLTATSAARAGKRRWIEKTPNHLLHIERIRSLYPDARIVRILRDPRDVALSLRNVPFASKSALANLYSWIDRDARGRRALENDSRTFDVRYEDLVTDPATALTRLCSFIGETFEDAMLHPHTAADSVIGSGEWWKGNVRRPISDARVAIWRRELGPGEQQVAALVCAEPLAHYGYPGGVAPRQTWRSQPLSAEFIEQNEGTLIELAALGVRLYPCNLARELPDVAWGLPGQLRWSLGATTTARIVTMGRLVLRMAARRLRGERIDWVAESTHLPQANGLIDHVCDAALRVTARRVRKDALLAVGAVAVAADYRRHAPREGTQRG